MGVALSHYNIWKNLCNNPDMGNLLILEDDVVLTKDFTQKWRSIAGQMPSDSDVIFLGGVLPPNKSVLPMLTENVNSSFARIKQCNIGGVIRRYFHFCLYSYIISPSGAKKLCNLIEEKGIFTSIDHMVVNHWDNPLNIYFTTPLLAGCFQDDDPVYQNADFNNFNRIDKFDSDLWNNNDCFSESEVKVVRDGAKDEMIFIYFEEEQQKSVEQSWIEEMFGSFKWVSHLEFQYDSTNKAPIIIFYQHTTPVSLLEGWINRNMSVYNKFFLFHASDESCTADISIYKHAGIIGVFRNYWRPNAVSDKVTHIPLGYLNGRRGDGKNKEIIKRPFIWSFAGAMDRPNRNEIFNKLEAIGVPYKIHRTPTWNSSENLGTLEYVQMLKDTRIVPCLNGFFNVESYRFYEALEHGAVPIITMDANNSYANIFCRYVDPPLLAVKEIGMLPDLIKYLGQNPDVVIKVQNDCMNWWAAYKTYLRKLVMEKLSGRH
jgi:hypothetical protein